MTGCGQRIDLGCFFLIGLAVSLLACGPRPSPLPAEIEYSGCRTVSLPGPVCALWPGPFPSLKLWVRVDRGTEVEIKADGERLNVVGQEKQGGRHFELPLPPESSSLTVRLRPREGPPGAEWSLALVSSTDPSWQAEILGLAGDPGKVRKRLLDLSKVVPRRERGIVFRMLAVRAHIEGRDEEAVAWLRQAIFLYHVEGLLSDEVDKGATLAFFLMEDGRFTEARQVLTNLQVPTEAPADARYQVAYYKGLLADSVGDYRSALENLQQASDLAQRGGLIKFSLDSGQVWARILQELGRSKEAAGMFPSLHALLKKAQRRRSAVDACDEASLLINEAWSRLLAEEGGEEAEDPTPLLERAQTLFEDRCGQPDQRLNVRLNLALAAQQRERWDAARRILSEAKTSALASHAKLDTRLWWLDLKGRQAIAEGDAGGALHQYNQLAEQARNAESAEGAFRAEVGRAHAQLKLGRPAEAVASFRQADRLIDEQTWHIPAYGGRDTFVAQRELEVRRYLQLLLDRKLRQAAFELVRRDRSRLLRQLAVRDRLAHLTDGEKQRWEQSLSRYWTLRAEMDRESAQEDLLPRDERKQALESKAAQLNDARKELDHAMAQLSDPRTREEGHPSPPGPGEVVLAYHPLPKGWVGFAATSKGIQVVATFDLPEDALAAPRNPGSLAALAPRLIGPFASPFQSARRVRVLPFGPLQAVDFHALPLAGEPLMARLPIVYGLDLPAHPFAATGDHPMALLVANPEGNLPEAQKESEDVADAVRRWGQGWTPKRLDGEKADLKAVRGALLGADLFDFAGHGVFEASGWDSALRLATGSSLTPRDLLTLPRVPAWVVLSTCEGGRSDNQAPGEGFGLAPAFLLAGSRVVVAATRPVLDTEARAFVVELYRVWTPGMDLAQPFQSAQLACRRRNPAGDWAAFRLFEP